MYVKYVYSEKATKFCEISTLLLSTVHTDKSKMDISQNFVAFSECMNFSTLNLTTVHRVKSMVEISQKFVAFSECMNFIIVLTYPIYRLILLNIERDQDLFVSIEEEIIKQFLVNNGYLGKLLFFFKNIGTIFLKNILNFVFRF